MESRTCPTKGPSGGEFDQRRPFLFVHMAIFKNPVEQRPVSQQMVVLSSSGGSSGCTRVSRAWIYVGGSSASFLTRRG